MFDLFWEIITINSLTIYCNIGSIPSKVACITNKTKYTNDICSFNIYNVETKVRQFHFH